MSTLKEEERGRGNGFMFGGQYLGIALGGGGAIFVFGFWGFNVALMYVSALLFLCLLFVVFFVRDPGRRQAGTTPRRRCFTQILTNADRICERGFRQFSEIGDRAESGATFLNLADRCDGARLRNLVDDPG